MNATLFFCSGGSLGLAAVGGRDEGAPLKGLRLLARAIFLLDKDDNVKYVEYVKELGMPPDYDGALKAIKSIVK